MKTRHIHDAQIAAEALRRSGILCAQRRRRRRNGLLGGSVLAFCLFTATVALQTQGMRPPMTVMATAVPSLLAGGVGGYVLAAVLGFALGMALTILGKTYKARKSFSKMRKWKDKSGQ
jgi:hypothetical protein